MGVGGPAVELMNSHFLCMRFRHSNIGSFITHALLNTFVAKPHRLLINWVKDWRSDELLNPLRQVMNTYANSRNINRNASK